MTTHLYPSFAVTTLTLGELDTNCYLVWCRETQECLVIDPADAGTYICEQLLDLQLQPVGIILTHGHFDHVLGCLEVSSAFGLPIMLHQKDVELLARAQASALHWLKHTVDPVPAATDYLQANQVIQFGNCALTVIETPGHTKGSVCLYIKDKQRLENEKTSPETDEPVLFTGDTVFAEGVGRTDFAYASGPQLKKSLALLKTYPDNTHCYAGHGADFILATRFRK